MADRSRRTLEGLRQDGPRQRQIKISKMPGEQGIMLRRNLKDCPWVSL